MNREVLYVRELARKVREIAELDIQKENKKLWKAVNDGKMIRPVYLTRDTKRVILAEGTQELDNQCTDHFLASIETDLLRTLYDWKHTRGDMVVEPFWRLPCVIKNTGFGLPPATTNSLGSANETYKTAVHYDPVIFTEDDIEKIKTPEVSFDREKTAADLARAREVLDGILDVRLFGAHAWRYQLWDNILSWTGLQEGFEMFYEEPELMHALADRLTGAFISQAKQFEALGLVSSNNANLFSGTGGYGYTDQLPPETESGIGAKLADIWGQAQDQIMTSVSPAMSKEFAFSHETAYTELFNRNYYGCCEKLDNKLTELETLPRLRKVSCSPFSDKEAFFEKAAGKYIVSFKASNLFLNDEPLDEGKIRRELEEVMDLCRKYNVSCEILMKTIVNLNGDPTRLWRWFDIADEVIRNY